MHKKIQGVRVGEEWRLGRRSKQQGKRGALVVLPGPGEERRGRGRGNPGSQKAGLQAVLRRNDNRVKWIGWTLVREMKEGHRRREKSVKCK